MRDLSDGRTSIDHNDFASWCNCSNFPHQKCDILVGLGECDIWGGLPAMRNTVSLEECLEEAYLHSVTSEEGANIIPRNDDIPKILDKVYSTNDVVKIDHFIQGCPPNADHIWKVVKSILLGHHIEISYPEFKYD